MKDNPFKAWREAMDNLERDTRLRRMELNRERDDLGISLLQDGHAIKDILAWCGTTSANWLYTACANRDLGTPAEVRNEALADPNRETLKKERIPGGYYVTCPSTEEEAPFIWEPEADAYTPKDTNVNRGSELHDVVKRFGAGLLPFPYPFTN